MGLLRKKHAFKVSALSLSVPLNGCDTVLGLQELQRQKDGEHFSRALQLGFKGASVHLHLHPYVNRDPLAVSSTPKPLLLRTHKGQGHAALANFPAPNLIVTRTLNTV